MLSGDTGISSEAICSVLTGSKARDRWGGNTPSDPSDFGRCHRLLLKFPEWRERLPEVAKRYPKWKPLVESWDELTAMYAKISEPDGTYSKRSYEANEEAAYAMYERMKQLLGEG